MSRRSRAREVALQLLFQADLNEVPVPRPAIEEFARNRLRDGELSDFTLRLYDGVLTHKPAIDETITKIADNWRLSRMLPADRNVLRMGCFELMFDPDRSPRATVIDEYIELSRRFGTVDSPKFVNGILDKVKESIPTPEA